MRRCVRAELLDRLPPGDPVAERSRRDLRWLNTWMGNDRIMAGALRTNWAEGNRHVADLGGGDGTFLLKVLQRVCHGREVIVDGGSMEADAGQRPVARIVDRHALVAHDSRRGFRRLGWHVEVWAADVLDWVRTAPARAELVVANLFLHHFMEEQLRELFAGIACRADLFVALEPRRSRLARMFSRCVGLIGCGPVTRHDAVASVAAGFRGRELSHVWGQRAGWVIAERQAGWFGHLFVARRGGVDYRRIEAN